MHRDCFWSWASSGWSAATVADREHHAGQQRRSLDAAVQLLQGSSDQMLQVQHPSTQHRPGSTFHGNDYTQQCACTYLCAKRTADAIVQSVVTLYVSCCLGHNGTPYEPVTSSHFAADHRVTATLCLQTPAQC